MSVTINKEAFEFAKELIRAGKIDISEDTWSHHQPSAKEENSFIDKDGMGSYSKWHLGIDTSENKDNKGTYKFPYGNFKKVYRSGIIAIKQRASQNDYYIIEKAADELMDLIEEQNQPSERAGK